MAGYECLAVKIVFDQDAEYSTPSNTKNPPAPAVFTGQRIRGTIQVYVVGSQDPSFDNAEVLLRGRCTMLQ